MAARPQRSPARRFMPSWQQRAQRRTSQRACCWPWQSGGCARTWGRTARMRKNSTAEKGAERRRAHTTRQCTVRSNQRMLRVTGASCSGAISTLVHPLFDRFAASESASSNALDRFVVAALSASARAEQIVWQQRAPPRNCRPPKSATESCSHDAASGVKRRHLPSAPPLLPLRFDWLRPVGGHYSVCVRTCFRDTKRWNLGLWIPFL